MQDNAQLKLNVYFMNGISVPYQAVFYTYQIHFEPDRFEV